MATISETDLQEAVRADKVFVERYGLAGKGSYVDVAVRVENIVFEKKVVARYTYNAWRTHKDISLRWDKSIEFTDLFVGVIPLPLAGWKGDIKFAVRYEVCGTEFWANNGGKNYSVRVN